MIGSSETDFWVLYFNYEKYGLKNEGLKSFLTTLLYINRIRFIVGYLMPL